MALKGVYKETKEAYTAQYRTTEGIFTVLIGNMIWGYLVIKYNQPVFNYILNAISSLPQFAISYVGYLLFGLLAIPLDLLILYVLSGVFKAIPIKNRKIF